MTTTQRRPRTVDTAPAERSSLTSIAVYLVLAFGLAWLACLPLWLGNGLTSPWFMVSASLMMFTPTVAALVATKVVERQPSTVRNLQIWPVANWPRMIITCLLVLALIMGASLLALVVAALLGQYAFDFSLAGYRAFMEGEMARRGMPGGLPMPIGVLAAVNLLSLPMNALIASVLTTGEEIGWRGFLQPRLQARLGAAGSVVAVGLIWGLWHAPLLLLGYNFPELSWPLRLVWMMVAGVILSAILAWAVNRSASVWPAAYGHGVINAGMPLLAAVFAAGPLNLSTTTLMGWTGWPVGLAVAAVLVLTGALKPWRPAS